MEKTTIAIIILTILLIWLISDIKTNRKNIADLKKANDDLNVEFGSEHGISLVKKQYPELNLRDDFRTGIEEAKGHNIANGMNSPSEMQKKAFEEENKDA